MVADDKVLLVERIIEAYQDYMSGKDRVERNRGSSSTA